LQGRGLVIGRDTSVAVFHAVHNGTTKRDGASLVFTGAGSRPETYPF